jgi:nucleotide-binding universal stress UspA family protein
VQGTYKEKENIQEGKAMKKILLAIDGSECAKKAVMYAGEQFSDMKNLKITLLHVLPYLATSLWDDGHILTEEERNERKKVVDRWTKNQQLKLEPMFTDAVGMLTKAGIKPEQIETRAITDSMDVADSILEEARNGGYQTLVLGRRGLSPAKRLLMGSVTAKIITHGAGIVLCIVE